MTQPSQLAVTQPPANQQLVSQQPPSSQQQALNQQLLVNEHPTVTQKCSMDEIQYQLFIEHKEPISFKTDS